MYETRVSFKLSNGLIRFQFNELVPSYQVARSRFWVIANFSPSAHSPISIFTDFSPSFITTTSQVLDFRHFQSISGRGTGWRWDIKGKNSAFKKEPARIETLGLLELGFWFSFKGILVSEQFEAYHYISLSSFKLFLGKRQLRFIWLYLNLGLLVKLTSTLTTSAKCFHKPFI